MRRLFASLIAAALLGPTLVPQAVHAADLHGRQIKKAAQVGPSCADPDVLAEVEDQFEYGAPRMLEKNLEILEFSGMRERAFIARRLAERIPDPQPIARRYCSASALISDHQRRPVFYVIEYPMNFAASGGYLGLFSNGWRTEGCVVGLDEWHVYGANCQSLRRYPPNAMTSADYIRKY